MCFSGGRKRIKGVQNIKSETAKQPTGHERLGNQPGSYKLNHSHHITKNAALVVRIWMKK